jgi:hypothetical protein
MIWLERSKSPQGKGIPKLLTRAAMGLKPIIWNTVHKLRELTAVYIEIIPQYHT